MSEESNAKSALENIVAGLKDLSPDKVEALLKRFQLMAEVELNKDVKQDKESKFFSPPLKKGQVVQVKFVGQGTAINGKHFALIWGVNPKEGQVVVLPMSSKIKKNQGKFNLGPIEGLRSPINLVLFQQSTTVARESIHIWTKRIKNEDNEKVDVPTELTEFQLKHMESIYRFTHLKEKDLFYKVCFETGNKVPQFIPAELLMHINKHLKVSVKSDNILYKLPHESEFKEFPLVSHKSINTKSRFRLLAGLISQDEGIRTATQQEIHDLITEKE